MSKNSVDAGELGSGWARVEFATHQTLGWRVFRSLHAGATVLPGSVEGAIYSRSFDSERLSDSLHRAERMLDEILGSGVDEKSRQTR